MADQSSPIAVSTQGIFTQVSAGINSGYGLREDGRVFSWGDNQFGQLGDNTLTGKSTPGIVAGIHKFDYIAAGWHHVLGLKRNASLWSWGRGTTGQLGTGTAPVTASSPVSVLGDHEFIKVDAGECHSIGLKADGTVWAWGCDDSGQLGAVQFEIGAIGAGATGFAGAIDRNTGYLWMWGLNYVFSPGWGLLGDGTTTDRSSPVTVAGPQGWAADTRNILNSALDRDEACGVPGVCAGIGVFGDNQSWAIKEDGSMWMWGEATQGNLGNGQWEVNKSSPTSVLYSGAYKFWIGATGAGNTACALDEFGYLFCWGNTGQYPLAGLGGATSFSSPKDVEAIMHSACGIGCTHPFIARAHKLLSMGSNGGLTLDFAGGGFVWGENSQGRLCTNDTTGRGSPDPVATGVGWPSVWKNASMGEANSIWLDNSGNVWMCGYNEYYNAMSPPWAFMGGPINRSTPTIVLGSPHNAIKVATGIQSATHGFLRADGSLWMWGENNNGECGVGTTSVVSSPTSVLGSGQSYSFVNFVIGGESGTVAIDSDGQVWAWGNWPHIGDNTRSNRSIPTATSLAQITPETFKTSPTLVPTDILFKDIAAGDNHNIAISEVDEVWAWGDNTGGQLGDGTTTNKSSPISVSGLSDIIDIAAGTQYSYALDVNGLVWQWGDVPCGNPTSTPAAMPLPCGFDIDCDYQTTLMTGSLWGWGDNSQGQLGIGDITDRWVPTLIKSRSFKDIGVGTYHNVVLENDGTARAFGDNSVGQLGNNTTTDSSYPVSVVGGHVFVKVCAGFAHTCGMKLDGSVWCWGSNDYGELGAALPPGSSTRRSSPVSVADAHSFVDLVCSGRNTFGIKANGEAWAWGRDYDGSLGTAGGDQSRPASVLGGYNWRQIQPGTNYTVQGTDVDGNSFGWGTNDYGEVGDNTQTNRSSPTPTAGGHKFIKAVAGSFHSMGLKDDGSVWAWGRGEEAGLYNGCALGIESAGQNYSSPISVYRTWMFDRLASGIGPGYNYSPGTRSVWTDDYRDDLFNPAGKAISFIDIKAGYYHNIGLEQRPEGCRIWKWGQGAGARMGIDTIELVSGTPLYTPASTVPSYDDMWFPGKDFFDTSYGASSNLAPYWLTWGQVARSNGMHMWSGDGASTDTQNMAYAVAYVGSSNFAFNTFFRINQAFWASSNWQRCGIFFWIDHENWFGAWRTYADGEKREVRQTVNGVGSTRSATANTDFELGFQLGRTDTDFNVRWGNDGVTWNNIGTWSLGGWAGKSGFIGLFANHSDEFPGTPPDVLSFGVTFDWIKASSVAPPAGWTPAYGNP